MLILYSIRLVYLLVVADSIEACNTIIYSSQSTLHKMTLTCSHTLNLNISAHSLSALILLFTLTVNNNGISWSDATSSGA